jgi:hypothetical protein
VRVWKGFSLRFKHQGFTFSQQISDRDIFALILESDQDPLHKSQISFDLNQAQQQNGRWLEKYKLDRTVVTALSFEEAEDHTSYWKDKTPGERLNAARFIINQIYGVTPQTKVDTSILDSRKHAC